MKTERPTARRILGMVIGIVIISLGIAIFKQSQDRKSVCRERV